VVVVVVLMVLLIVLVVVNVEGEEENKVVEVVRRGYMLGDKVIRVGQVKVSKSKANGE
jgi:molecular chaperone GrpE (heat shock protein)